MKDLIILKIGGSVITDKFSKTPKVSPENLRRISKEIASVYDKEKLLVQKRSPTKDKYPNRYDCSLSSQVRLGERYEETAIRELEEELGIRNVELKPILRFRMPYGRKDYHVCKLFRCNYNGEIKPNEEVSKIEFLEMGELKKIVNEEPKMLTPWFVEILKWHFKMNNNLHVFESY